MSDPITTAGEWAANQSVLAELTAQYELFDSMNVHGTYNSQLTHLAELYQIEAKRGLDTPHPYRDFVVRTKAWAMARAMFSGRFSDEDFSKYRAYQGFVWVNDLYRDSFTQEYLQADYERGNDLDLSYWMEAVVFFYANRLLNLADRGDRPETTTNHWAYERLVNLTHQLEQAEWFDEMFVVRTAVQYCAFVVSGFFLRPTEEHKEFLARAGELLWELNSVAVVENDYPLLPRTLLPESPNTRTQMPSNHFSAWQQNQTMLARWGAMIDSLEFMSQAEDLEDLTKATSDLRDSYIEELTKSLSSGSSVRDAYIRIMAQAITHAMCVRDPGEHRQVDQEHVVFFMCTSLSTETMRFVKENTSVEEWKAATARVQDAEFSKFIEATLNVCCGALLQFADGSDNQPDDEVPMADKLALAKYVAHFEQQGWLQEMFVARIAIMYRVFAVRGLFMRPPSESNRYIEQAMQLMWGPDPATLF